MAKKLTRLEKNVAIMKLAVLYYVPIKTIAIAVGCTRNAVSRRVRKGMEQLQELKHKRICKLLNELCSERRKTSDSESRKKRRDNKAKPKSVVKSIKQARRPVKAAAKSIKQVRKPVKTAAKTVKRTPAAQKRPRVVKSADRKSNPQPIEVQPTE